MTKFTFTKRRRQPRNKQTETVVTFTSRLGSSDKTTLLSVDGMAIHRSNLSCYFKISRIWHQSKQYRAKSFASSSPTSETTHLKVLTGLLRDTCSLKCLRELHARLAVAGAIQDRFVVTGLVERYVSFGKPASAALLFAEAYRGRPAVYSLNLAVRCFSDHGFHRELLGLYRELCGFGSDNFTFPPVIRACTAASCLRPGREVHCRVLRTGHGGSVGVQTALLDMYAKAGQIDVSRRVFDCMVLRDLISWNAMVSGYSLNGCFREAVETLQEMQQCGMRPNASTLVGIVGMCGSAGDRGVGNSLHAFALKGGAIDDESLTSVLISMYAAFDDLSSSRMVFDLHPVKGLASFNSMMSAYMQHSIWKEAFEVFRLMHCAGVGPNLVTLLSVLPSCSDFFWYKPWGVCAWHDYQAWPCRAGFCCQCSCVHVFEAWEIGLIVAPFLLFY